MDEAFCEYAAVLPVALLTFQGSSCAYRFAERDIHHVLVMKLALVQSTLRAALLLLQNGYLTQQGMLQRVVDEANQDILFLVFTNGEETELRKSFLEAFWQEELNNDGNLSPQTKRPTTPRKKIRAAIGRASPDPSTTSDLMQMIDKLYSGFVHGAAPHIMDSYDGTPPHFNTRGMLGTTKIKVSTDDLWNYMYRSLSSHILVGKVFGMERVVETLIKHKKQFELVSGKDT